MSEDWEEVKQREAVEAKVRRREQVAEATYGYGAYVQQKQHEARFKAEQKAARDARNNEGWEQTPGGLKAFYILLFVITFPLSLIVLLFIIAMRGK